MPKSKQQKQIDAIARNRRWINQDRQHYLDCQPGGDVYKQTVKDNHGDTTYADQKAAREKERFIQRSNAAFVDAHGNPLTVEFSTTGTGKKYLVTP